MSSKIIFKTVEISWREIQAKIPSFCRDEYKKEVAKLELDLANKETLYKGKAKDLEKDLEKLQQKIDMLQVGNNDKTLTISKISKRGIVEISVAE